VALIPSGEDRNYAENVGRELEILRWLSLQRVDIRTPRAVALIDDQGASILVESFVEGSAVDLRTGRQPICPWEFVAEIAAKIHAVPPPPNLPMQTRQQVRLELIEAIERTRVLGEGPRPELVDEALAWMHDHLGPPLPCVLVHGDLLGQNLRLHPSEAPGVIDWHHANVGDPAADLAIVTRGIRRPFQIAGGRQRLLDSYNQRAATEVSAESLRFFELELLTRWVVERHTESYFDDAWLNQIEHLLGRRT
jgi:aminoglycoside phosphotransferase (APT) family kinase protein